MKQTVERKNIKLKMSDIHDNSDRVFDFFSRPNRPNVAKEAGLQTVSGGVANFSWHPEQKAGLSKWRPVKKRKILSIGSFGKKKRKIKVVQEDVPLRPASKKRSRIKRYAEGVMMFLSAVAITGVLVLFGSSEAPKIGAFLFGPAPREIVTTEQSGPDDGASGNAQNSSIIVSGDSNEIFKEDLVLWALGYREPKKYLIVLQNGFVPRPAGGLSAAYLHFSMERGEVRDLLSGNFYDIDQGLKNKINPPEQLSVYSNIWGANSANWFADFPLSAKKTATFFKESTGRDVDLLIAADMRSMFVDILDQPDNKLSQMDDAKIKSLAEALVGEFPSPKKMLVEKNDYFTGLARSGKVAVYSADENIQKIIVESGLGGYFAPAGLKDYYYASPVSLDPLPRYLLVGQTISDSVRITNNKEAVHDLKIDYDLVKNTNQKKYGKDTYYLKLHLPKGAELRSASGFFRPKLKSKDPSFANDSDILAIESGKVEDPSTGLEFYEEGESIIVGGYFQVSGRKARVNISYAIPDVFIRPPSEYDLTFFSQPGLQTAWRASFSSEDGLEFRPISEDIVGSIFAGSIEGKKVLSLGVEGVPVDVPDVLPVVPEAPADGFEGTLPDVPAELPDITEIPPLIAPDSTIQ